MWLQSGPQCPLSQAAIEASHSVRAQQSPQAPRPGQGMGPRWRLPRGLLPLWQLRPVHPGAQLQRPVAGWQCPSLAQEHRVWQPGPNQPAGQAAGGRGVRTSPPPGGGGRGLGRGGAALTILAAAAGEARAAQAGSRLGLTGGTMLTRRADLLTAQPPAALGTLFPHPPPTAGQSPPAPRWGPQGAGSSVPT